ncbi:hypothetical protein CEV33_1293 [Brucella grignonensis]|uniref:Uncharacterized protein n=1 Tax=Brucella grignonensis TaxID=94627 RepID=A0A256FCA9_9HYPH|nr:hypothetical protein CEV33_1293 [Brucella grignonensis]
MRPLWRSSGRRRTLAHPKGAGQHRRNFLVPRGMSALPAGEESCDDAVALGRSKRIALVFGQIRPLKRPFGAVETRGLNGDVATLRLHQDDLTGNTGLSCHHASQIMRISASGLFHRHATTRGFPSVCTRWCRPSCAPMGRVCAPG